MTIVLIHTVQSVLQNFGEKVKKELGDIKIINILDEFLASDPAEKGEFTINNMNRLFNTIKNGEMTGADVVVVTCSTLSPTVEKIRDFISIPLITIDEAMIKKAVSMGTKVTIMATAESTIKPTRDKLLSESIKLNKALDIDIICCDQAYDAIKKGDKELHDELLRKGALQIKQRDVVVLAQASMSHMEEIIEKICGCPVLSSPKHCINELKSIICREKY
ncbi:aspartate/glutamate racemase family protein [Clostridium sp. MSJ-11]|uniref:Aspartate/glutamate racemase family protein n=1 Tax=Clostridium mobile TaxID=2841512 RepID=A0ABS6ENA9_9CLOT|nr:aspartate/glutamate racemase family protein [Clostridium mobile]MBU5485875.1 aspartate/glutamate racemase family protein [Clostridium mobile]